ncbi:protein scylla-like [Lucilia cuprina]|uniref:protein scylla-like n=1 Tax=Lucilia cuprina TaxID=7375 RepID=UPI001F060366|nr:protein scylla-like [Lucilia cuprina]
MNMEVLSVQNQYPAHFALATDWKSQLTLSTPTNGGSLKSQPSYKFTSNPFKPHHHINHPHHHHQRKQQNLKTSNSVKYTSNSSNKLNCDTIKTTKTTTTTTASKTIITNKSLQTQAVQELSLRLLDKLRAAKSQHLACTEVSLPCDLTPRIALEILRLAREETNGLRDCTIYIEFEDEPNNSRRIATLDLNNQRSGNTGYEIYVTLSQDHRGWTALLPQFMKNLSRTITISPEFNITKHRPYSKSLC